MTKFKVYRISGTGAVYVEIIEAFDWASLFMMNQYSGHPIFKVEVFDGTTPQGA